MNWKIGYALYSVFTLCVGGIIVAILADWANRQKKARELPMELLSCLRANFPQDEWKKLQKYHLERLEFFKEDVTKMITEHYVRELDRYLKNELLPWVNYLTEIINKNYNTIAAILEVLDRHELLKSAPPEDSPSSLP